MRLIKSFACAILGYILGALITYLTVGLFSTNTHDLEIESAMMGAFFGGPFVAFISMIYGFLKYK